MSNTAQNYELQVKTPEEASMVLAATLAKAQKDASNVALQIVKAQLIPCYDGSPLPDGQPIPNSPITGHLVRFTIQ